MSDQQTPPPKPKPGSLRDRIAAFEKPTGGSPPGPAPAPRPKPGGISWKPKQPSPPSSPLSTDGPSERKVGGGMSASDAKESIGKGGSLKERMAALQNRGGFGALPPIAPKPALEKPKWKPPPVITPVDKDDDDEPSRSESSKSPPPIKKLSLDRPTEEGVEEEPAPAVGSEDQEEVDPEEEERQRRAAIAARIARLGGARVGMAPVFGRNPAAKKPEPQEEEPSKVQAPKEDEEIKDTAVVSPPDKVSEEASQPPEAALDRYPKPTRKGSESSSLLSPEPDSQQSRSPPTSMPLPSAPRRAVPPRRKAAKSPEIPPATALAEPLADSPEAVPTLDPTGAADPSAVIAESVRKAVVGDVQEEVGEVDKDAVQTQVVMSSRPDEAAPTGVEFSKKESAVDELFDEDDTARDEPSIPIVDEMSIEPQTEAEERLDITTSSHSLPVPQHASTHDHEEAEVQSRELDAPDTGVSMSQVQDDGEESVAQVADESEEDEEAARRQRIAEKLAKMGGVNPFAPPPQRKPSGSSEDVQTSPTLTKRASISRDSVGSPPPPPQRRQSTRQASVDSYPALEGEVTQASDPQFTKSPVARPLSRKNTSESAEVMSDSLSTLSRTKSQDDSWQVSRDAGVVSPMRIPEETEYSDNEEEAFSTGEAGREGSKTDHDNLVTSVAFEGTEDAGPADDFDDNPVMPPPPPPVPNLSTRPVSITVPLTPALPVDPAVSANPVPVPPRSVEAAAISPARPPPPPPPRLIPQPNEFEEEASGSELSYTSPPSQVPSDDEYDEPPRRLPPRSVPNETTEDESLPLPVLNRRSSEMDNHSRDSSHTTSGRPLRSIPPPPPLSASISDLEQDSDFDEALPTRPRHRPMTPGAPPTNEIPLIVPPPTSDNTLKKIEPSPLRHSSYSASEQTVVVPAPTAFDQDSPSHLSPPLSVSEQEILDEEEGDPIDPSFYSPSRRTSTIISPPTSPPPAEPEEDEQAAHRRTIAERMAKLGGIKFGAAPLPPSMHATSPPPREEAAPDVGEEQTAQPSEEEEERARKERIAAKLAGMGGMRIGMMPLGVGAVRPQASHVLTEETPSALPSRAVPPTRPPPPPRSQDSDAEHDSSLSASQHSLATSDEGVKVEAEESEIEEVSYADAEQPDEELEEVPPPVPVRGPRRRGTGSETEHASTSPPPRPPVPTGLPSRKSSVQTTTSVARKSSADSSRSVQRMSYKPQSEYVMVEEPSGFVPDEDVPPPLPPSRPLNRPPARGVPAPPPASVQALPPSDSISSQWELPSFPSSSLEFGGTTDLSLSWPEDSNPASSSLASPPPPPPEKSPVQQPTLVLDQPRSSDDLIAVWGRVGVQICEVATTLFDNSKKSLVGDGTYEGFVRAVLSEVPNAAMPSSPASYGYLVYVQTGSAVQKRTSEIMPGDVLVLQDAKLKGHKGLQTYHQMVGVGEPLVGIVSEFEPKKSKVKLFQANQHVGQQTVEAVSYRLEDLKSGTVKVYRVLEN